jgi:predicted DNA-binding ribbon-helix-helix protein
MKEISSARGMTLSELVGEIDSQRKQGNLSSAIRLFVLDHYRSMTVSTADVHHTMHESLVSSQAAE